MVSALSWFVCQLTLSFIIPQMSEPTNCMSLHMCDMVFALDLGGYTKYHDTLKFLKVYKHSNHIKSKLHLSSDDTNLLSSRLRLLHWDAFPLTTFPCRFRPRDLIEISLHRSNLTIFWKETMVKALNRSMLITMYLPVLVHFDNFPILC